MPYDLSVRASVVSRLPVSTAAAFMGHSVTTHTQVYHRWLNDATNQEVYDRLILGSDHSRRKCRCKAFLHFGTDIPKLADLRC